MTGDTNIAVILTAPAWRKTCPRAVALCRRAAQAALATDRREPPGPLAIVLAGDGLVRRLNRDYRGQDKPTNVLSFAERDGGMAVGLGDVVLAHGTVAREARAQGKALAAHMSHLVVHGVLHLLGHDHIAARDARRMEALEVAVLAGLGIADPYVERSAA
ncbi:MAG: rRNA maturation RNase YbeY [Alphaproteobacteria bacterium]|nr:rRNA maturation RNase YbeY [Alphaproteobacteria bacterium]